jgi:succinyl-CoA synthetase beta subunit
MRGNLGYRSCQPLFLAIEVDQQNHMPVRIATHFGDVGVEKLLQDLPPSTRHVEDLELAGRELQMKAVR